MIRPDVLVVDDEHLVAWSACRDLAQWGYLSRSAGSLAEARAAIAKKLPDIILLDIHLPDGRGLDLLNELPKDDRPSVIIISAIGDIPTVVEATKLGASDFLTKPFEADDLYDALLRLRIVDGRVDRSAPDAAELARFGILSSDPRMLQLLGSLRCFARTPRSTVLILGETGTGKSLAAGVLHRLSARANGPFVQINCAAVPETLIESELMGHERGAYTDAKTARRGLLEAANGGTLLLDEIGDMPMGMQAKLLRFIETHAYRRLGSTVEIASDVRVVASTHRDLADLVSHGRFREDLYYRLKVLTVTLPPLRERSLDVDLLADHFLRHSVQEMGSTVLAFSQQARGLLRAHPWHGNVRELKHAIEAAVAIAGDSRHILPDHLPPELQLLQPSTRIEAQPTPALRSDTAASPSGLVDAMDLSFRLDGSIGLADIERLALERALSHCEGNQVRAARLLGVSRDLLRYRLKKFGLIE